MVLAQKLDLLQSYGVVAKFRHLLRSEGFGANIKYLPRSFQVFKNQWDFCWKFLAKKDVYWELKVSEQELEVNDSKQYLDFC